MASGIDSLMQDAEHFDRIVLYLIVKNVPLDGEMRTGKQARPADSDWGDSARASNACSNLAA